MKLNFGIKIFISAIIIILLSEFSYAQNCKGLRLGEIPPNESLLTAEVLEINEIDPSKEGMQIKEIYKLKVKILASDKTGELHNIFKDHKGKIIEVYYKGEISKIILGKIIKIKVECRGGGLVEDDCSNISKLHKCWGSELEIINNIEGDTQ